MASVMDMASRRVLGFALGEHHDAQLAYSALVMAVAVRGGQVPGVILHTDYAEVCVKPRKIVGNGVAARSILDAALWRRKRVPAVTPTTPAARNTSAVTRCIEA
jgi:hypothetical protein